VIGLVQAARQPPSWSEFVKGAMAVVLLAVVTGLIISLPERSWDRVVPVAWLFPMLLWIAARCRPLFTAVGVFLVSMTIISSTILGIGYFGDTARPIAERSVHAVSVTLFVTFCGLVLAALFAERRVSEARLAHSNKMLQRERDNKLLNSGAVAAAIAHEVRQPLLTIELNASTGLLLLEKPSPQQHEIRDNLRSIESESRRANEVLDSIRALFGKSDQRRELVNVNQLILDVVRCLQGEFQYHKVSVHFELAEGLPLVNSHPGQLREVVFNLVNNALEAVNAITDRSRVLRLTTNLHDPNAIAVSVEDTGPGIEPELLQSIFEPFVTTKPQGTGLGLAICRMIVEQHGGQVTASSDGKNGATFQFVLPSVTTDQSTHE